MQHSADKLHLPSHYPIEGDRADCGPLSCWLRQVGAHLDRFLQFRHADAMHNAAGWRGALNRPLPLDGAGMQTVIDELGEHVIPNGSQIPHPGFTSFITTGATSVGALTALAGTVAAQQRITQSAFHFLEALSLQWLAELFELPHNMQGVYSSGGSVANLVALGAARQWAFERIGVDASAEGVRHPARIYASSASHRTIFRAAAVLGLGRDAVIPVATDAQGRMCVEHLANALAQDVAQGRLPIAIVATAGTTGAGAIDPLRSLSELTRRHSTWLHVDGAYGLPGMLDPQARPLFDGLAAVDSVVVDAHKWLGAPVGIGATFVRDREVLRRAFAQGAADYLEGSCSSDDIKHSLDGLGEPYSDYGVELSAPPRGAVVWALLREIGATGLRERVCRHNAMARWVAEQAQAHPNLEALNAPMLSIACIRYVPDSDRDVTRLNDLNRRIHRELVRNGCNMPSTTVIDGQFAIRACFIGARTTWTHAESLLQEILAIGHRLTNKRDAHRHYA